MIKIMFVCYGNICRSPMAEFIMKDLVAKNGESENFYIKSGATSYEENGNPVHYGTRKILDRLGISCRGKVSERISLSDYDKYDYFIGMDEDNLVDMKRMLGGDKERKVVKLLDFTSRGGDVADPYWTGDFEATYRDVKAGVEGLYNFLESKKS
jgi:protein-tyrosine phosphatase